ncbi:MAG: hypothetical protein KQJ78_12350 [Deltaproteobacteria bacterium]|nr:hypothetical protein [Deltaproteobacteria bacterium]
MALTQSFPGTSDSSGFESSNPLAPYFQTPLRLFMADAVLQRQVVMALDHLGFKQVTILKVDHNYFQAMRQLFGELMNFDGVLLVNHPAQHHRTLSGESYEDLNFQDFYGGVASLLHSSTNKPSEILAKCVPIFVAPQDTDVRERILKDLFPFGVMAAFMMRAQARKVAADTLLEERSQELHFYFLEYFLHKTDKLAQFKDFKTAEDLRARQAEVELLLNEVQRLKAAQEYDKAIALCRKAIDLLPTEPDAYLEGGRLLVRKKKYVPAMQMFKDAESVAQDLPTPNQEIAQMRVSQVKDMVLRAQQDGQPVDKAKAETYLKEALESFQIAIDKAETICTIDPAEQAERRRDLVAGISESILNLGLSGTLGENNPYFREMVSLAAKTLQKQVQKGAVVSPEYLIQFAMVAFFEGDVNQAERDLLQAAQNPDYFVRACTKLNHIGTQLRQKADNERAIRIYKRLLSLNPPFRGVVLFNLAVAQQSKAFELRESQSPEIAILDKDSLGAAVEALMEDPELPTQANFYHNKIIAPLLSRGIKLFSVAYQQMKLNEDPVDLACHQASRELERLLAEGKEGQVIQQMFRLASKLPAFFLRFDEHASEAVLAFTERLHPIMLKRSEPRMQTLGKIFGILVAKGRARRTQGGATGDPVLDKVLLSLQSGERGRAARELVMAIYATPQILKNTSFLSNKAVAGLCREIGLALSKVEMLRFGPAANA